MVQRIIGDYTGDTPCSCPQFKDSGKRRTVTDGRTVQYTMIVCENCNHGKRAHYTSMDGRTGCFIHGDDI